MVNARYQKGEDVVKLHNHNRNLNIVQGFTGFMSTGTTLIVKEIQQNPSVQSYFMNTI